MEFSADGEVDRGATRVLARVEEDGARVVIVQAHSKQEAEAIAYRQRQRMAQRHRRTRLRAEGKCDCGRARDLPGKTCSHCLKTQKDHTARYLARKRGEVVPPVSKAPAFAARRAEQAEAVRLEVLEEIDRQWTRLGTAGFRLWLRREIRSLKAKEVA